MTPEQADSVMRRIGQRAVEQPDGCWRWTGHLDRDGYGKFKVGGRTNAAHRASWEAFRGDIPDGLHVDHLCRNRACVNPWHFDLVTIRINTQRGDLTWKPERKIGRLMDECRAGHALSGDNIYVRTSADGYTRRECKRCARDRLARWQARRRQVSAA